MGMKSHLTVFESEFVTEAVVVCSCLPNTYGKTCNNAPRICTIANPCLHGSTCSESQGQAVCDCTPGGFQPLWCLASPGNYQHPTATHEERISVVSHSLPFMCASVRQMFSGILINRLLDQTDIIVFLIAKSERFCLGMNLSQLTIHSFLFSVHFAELTVLYNVTHCL